MEQPFNDNDLKRMEALNQWAADEEGENVKVYATFQEKIDTHIDAVKQLLEIAEAFNKVEG